MCERVATTTEHAPPKCFFPEHKDVGRDLRKNLVSVPSCDEHNTAKSTDDQYAMACLVMHCDTTGVARDQFTTKIIRSLKRDLTLVGKVFHGSRPVTVDGQPTLAVTVDRGRLDRVVACTVRALVFHHTGDKLIDDVAVFSTGLRYPNFETDANESALGFSIRKVLRERPRFGANPEVFWYQYVHGLGGITAMRLEFYHGLTFYAVSKP